MLVTCPDCGDNYEPLIGSPGGYNGHSCAATFLDRVRRVARACGYAVAVHGSQRPERDLDLIAAPWTPEAVSADHLVHRLCEEVGLVERQVNTYADPEGPRIEPNPEHKPWGRIAWSLAGCPDHQYVDLSVAPRAGEPVPLRSYTSRARKAAA